MNSWDKEDKQLLKESVMDVDPTAAEESEIQRLRQQNAELAAALENERSRFKVIRDFLLVEQEWDDFRGKMLRDSLSTRNFGKLSQWLKEHPESDPRTEQEILTAYDAQVSAATRRPLLKALRDLLSHIPHDAAGTTFWDDDDGEYAEHYWYCRAKTLLARYNEDGTER